MSLSWRVDQDWSGTYLCQIRKTRKPTGTLVGTLTIVADWDSVTYPDETLFTMTMSEGASELIVAGKYFLDMQEVGGTTRIWGPVEVEAQVSVVP